MTDLTQPCTTTDTQEHPTWLIHPLAPHVFQLLHTTTTVGVTHVAYALAGAHVSPRKGQEAYRIVAADVLEFLTCQGLLARHGNGDPSKPEDGGFVYRRAERQATRCIRAMLLTGMTPDAIAFAIQIPRRYVYQIRRGLRTRGLMPPYTRSTAAPLAHEGA